MKEHMQLLNAFSNTFFSTFWSFCLFLYLIYIDFIMFSSTIVVFMMVWSSEY